MRNAVSLAVCVLMMVAAMAQADHLPDSLLAAGKPEKLLAGLNIEHSKVKDAIRRFGKPTRIDKDRYSWERRNCTIELVSSEATGPSDRLDLISVQRKGRSKVSIGTGKGLRIGDSIEAVARIYGRKFHEHIVPGHKIHEIMVQWRGPEFSLIASLDSTGRIEKLSLFAPE
ncbi:hypothetical protein ANRL1_00836 [Anaerolineae bacterium]|nr:hypothetical protein ANRL1_00836 [Anaerolineae bacterium]